jgi:hypothetical protein
LTSSQQSSPRRETGRGLFESDGGRIFRTPHPPMQRIDARRVSIELPSEPLKAEHDRRATRGVCPGRKSSVDHVWLAGTRERVGTRRGQGHARTRPREG